MVLSLWSIVLSHGDFDRMNTAFIIILYYSGISEGEKTKGPNLLVISHSVIGG